MTRLGPTCSWTLATFWAARFVFACLRAGCLFHIAMAWSAKVLAICISHYCLTDLSVDSNDITALVSGDQKHYFHMWGLQKPLVAFATALVIFSGWLPISAYTQKRLYPKAPLPKSAYTEKRVYPKALHKTSFRVIWPRFRADNPNLTLV
jgi:hypothetical protein